MNKIFKIQEKIINLIYPQTCGICGKINHKAICPKCNIQLKKQEKNVVLHIVGEGNQKNMIIAYLTKLKQI